MVFSHIATRRAKNPSLLGVFRGWRIVREQELVPILPVDVHDLLEHLLERLVEAFHESVGLGMVHRGAKLFHLEEAKQLVG